MDTRSDPAVFGRQRGSVFQTCIDGGGGSGGGSGGGGGVVRGGGFFGRHIGRLAALSSFVFMELEHKCQGDVSQAVQRTKRLIYRSIGDLSIIMYSTMDLILS